MKEILDQEFNENQKDETQVNLYREITYFIRITRLKRLNNTKS